MPKIGGLSVSAVPLPLAPFSRLRLPSRPFFEPHLADLLIGVDCM